MKILIVDDEPDVRWIANLALAKVGGMEVVDAAGGAGAIRIAEQERPDAILLDVMMPGMDGLSTLRTLKASTDTAAIPVIFLTATTHAGDVKRLLEVGAIGIVKKPFDPMRLAAQVRAILDGR
jgi:DNA-binding response OmpR family regulator